MGCKFTNNQYPETGEITGRGGFGRVWKVEKKSSKKIMAMKIMSKVKVVDKNSINNINNELFLLTKINHPFLIPVHFAFQDKDYLYLVMNYFSGGDLRFHLLRRTKFNEEQAKFIISCLILGLEYLHSNSIIHRDLKPENLIFDEDGYVHLTDLGVAKLIEKHKELIDSSGTPGYMAPEVINHMHHTLVADFFSLGVIVYELIMGKRPYRGKTRKDIKTEMLLGEVKITCDMIPYGWSLESADFANKLLKRRAHDRLGNKGISEVKSHSWLKDVEWERLYRKEIISSFVPNRGDNYDFTSANKKEAEIEKYQEILERVNNDKEFCKYYFDITDSTIKNKIQYLPNPHIQEAQKPNKKVTQPGFLIAKKKSYLNSSIDIFGKSEQDISPLWINKPLDESNSFFKSSFARERNLDELGNFAAGNISIFNNNSYINIKQSKDHQD